MSDNLNLDAKTLTNYAYIQILNDDQLRVICNYCTGSRNHIIYEGDDTRLPDSDWVAELVTHIADKHPSAGVKTT
jgi:hypothetical protein